MTSAGRLMQFPPIPGGSRAAARQSFVIVEAAYIGSEEDGAELLQPLRELGPVMDTFATIPVEDLRHLHMDPPQPVPGAGDGMTLATSRRRPSTRSSPSPVPAPARRSSRSSSASSAARSPTTRPSHGAVGAIDAGFALFAVGMAATPR